MREAAQRKTRQKQAKKSSGIERVMSAEKWLVMVTTSRRNAAVNRSGANTAVHARSGAPVSGGEFDGVSVMVLAVMTAPADGESVNAPCAPG